MIPLHRPYFGIGTVLAQSVKGGEAKTLRRLEEAYAKASGCEFAVWLPSGRAGICWALRAAIEPGTKVVGPAFTCTVVHEAIARSGGSLQLVDAGENDFLMDPANLAAAQSGRFATVLSEPYGHTYDLQEIARRSSSPSLVRIVDMAMAVPSADLFQRLGPNDFALISFGAGKSMYAGWGAMGFTRNRALTGEVTGLRDSMLAKSSVGLVIRRMAKVGLRTTAHYPLVYSAAWQCWYWGRRTFPRIKRLFSHQAASPPPKPGQSQLPAEWSDERTCSAEWSLPSTHLDRGLALWNLERAESVCRARIALARRYHENLAGTEGVIEPRGFEPALSHYSVRLDPRIRDAVKRQLFASGIYTLSPWTFPPHLNRGQFPHTQRLSSQVVNLPLSPWLTTAQVDRICEVLRHSVESEAARF